MGRKHKGYAHQLARQDKWRKEHYDRVLLAQRKHRAKKRAWIQELKLSVGCVDCGYNSHPEALEFDHLPGFEKVASLNTFYTMSMERVLEEIAKCEVVCANCHRVRTASRRGESAWG